MVRKRLFSFLFIVAILMFTLTGCGSSALKSDIVTNTIEQLEAAETQMPVAVTTTLATTVETITAIAATSATTTQTPKIITTTTPKPTTITTTPKLTTIATTSKPTTIAATQVPTVVATTKSGVLTNNYVLNTNSMKFHFPSCGSAAKISPENREDVIDSRENIITKGYSPCGNCDP